MDKPVLNTNLPLRIHYLFLIYDSDIYLFVDCYPH